MDTAQVFYHISQAEKEEALRHLPGAAGCTHRSWRPACLHPHALTHSRPKWHDRITHYSPTSIIWRYAAITDRRIRAKAWDRADMAASNTLFWTARRWDGPEAIVEESVPYCSHLPENTHMSLFSAEMLKTVIVTLPGFQAIVFISNIFGPPSYNDGLPFADKMGLDFIFFPFAFMGLVRIVSCPWLGDDFSYHYSPPEILRSEPSKRQEIPKQDTIQ